MASRTYKFPMLLNSISSSLKFNRYTSDCTKSKLLKTITEPILRKDDKITLIGTGQVGISAAFLLLTHNITKNLVLMDNDEKKLLGEVADLQNGSLHLDNCKVEPCTDYTKTANSKIVIFTAGARSVGDESRLSLLQRNVDILKESLPQIVKYSPNAILLLVSNPVDVLAYASWKISGLASIKVIGSGTNLDTSRFRFFISQKLGVATTSCHGFIVGEHGDSSVPLWSSVNVAGIKLRELNPEAGTEKDTENWSEIHKQVVQSAYKVIKLKGYTCWAIATSIVAIVRDMMKIRNMYVQAVSTNAKGYYGIENDVYLSLPCLLDSRGLSQVVRMPISDLEQQQLRKSAQLLTEVQNSIKF